MTRRRAFWIAVAVLLYWAWLTMALNAAPDAAVWL